MTLAETLGDKYERIYPHSESIGAAVERAVDEALERAAQEADKVDCGEADAEYVTGYSAAIHDITAAIRRLKAEG